MIVCKPWCTGKSELTENIKVQGFKRKRNSKIFVSVRKMESKPTTNGKLQLWDSNARTEDY